MSSTGVYDPQLPIGLLGHDVDSVHYVSLGHCENMSNVFMSVRGMANYDMGANKHDVHAVSVSDKHKINNETSNSAECPTQCRGLPKDIAHDLSNGPVQPKLTKFPLTQFGSQKRAFSCTNYERYPFIEYSVSADAIFALHVGFFHLLRVMPSPLLYKLGLVTARDCWHGKTCQLPLSPTKYDILDRVEAFDKKRNSIAENW